jgi:Ca-activated chloride channel family protein
MKVGNYCFSLSIIHYPLSVITMKLFYCFLWLTLCVLPLAAQNPSLDDPLPAPRPRRVLPTPTPTPAPTPEDPVSLDDDDIVRVTSNLIVVPVSVTDGQGNPVLGLKAGDFRLEEEGRPREIAAIGDPGQVPLDIAVLLDVSGSVNPRFEFEREAAIRFLREVLRSGDRAAILTIGEKSQLIHPLDSAEKAIASLRAVQATKGPTAFYDTVVDAVRHLAEKTTTARRRVIVVISDGQDNFSQKIQEGIGNTAEQQLATALEQTLQINERERNATQRELQRGEAAFYSINPSASTLHLDIPAARAQNGMERIAQATGGNFFLPVTDGELTTAFRQIASELRSQYLLQYYANDTAADGQFLRISVTAPTRPNAIIRARQGYYAKRK